VTDLQPKNYIRRAFNVSCQLVFGEDGRADQVLVEANITAVIYDESLRKSSSYLPISSQAIVSKKYKPRVIFGVVFRHACYSTLYVVHSVYSVLVLEYLSYTVYRPLLR
jgi:hypothetical protein